MFYANRYVPLALLSIKSLQENTTIILACHVYSYGFLNAKEDCLNMILTPIFAKLSLAVALIANK